METAASIIAVIQLSEKVVKYVRDASGATEERKRLREQVRGCCNILSTLRDGIEDSEEGEAWAETLDVLASPIARLHKALELAAVKLQKKDTTKEKLMWPFKEKEVQKLIEAVEGEKTLLIIALENNSTRLLREVNIRSKENNAHLSQLVLLFEAHLQHNEHVHKHLKDTLSLIQGSHVTLEKGVEALREHQQTQESREKYQQVVDWLSSIDHNSQQRDALSNQQSGTGQWLLNSQTYQTWQHAERQTLYCQGPPGAGKTTIASVIVRDLRTRYHDASSINVVFLYCGLVQREAQTPERLLSSILKQLVENRFSLSESITKLHDDHTEKNTEPSLHGIWQAIRHEAQSASMTFLLIDALDECRTDNGCRTRLLKELFSLQEETNLNLFATSRAIPEITKLFPTSMTLEIRASPDDIGMYLDDNMDRLPTFVVRNPALQNDIKSCIIKSTGGMCVNLVFRFLTMLIA